MTAHCSLDLFEGEWRPRLVQSVSLFFPSFEEGKKGLLDISSETPFPKCPNSSGRS